MEKKLILNNEVSEISKLQLFVDEIGEELNLAFDVTFNLNLVLEEAISNIILYAYPKEENQTLTIVAKTQDNNLIFVITPQRQLCIPLSVAKQVEQPSSRSPL